MNPKVHRPFVQRVKLRETPRKLRGGRRVDPVAERARLEGKPRHEPSGPLVDDPATIAARRYAAIVEMIRETK